MKQSVIIAVILIFGLSCTEQKTIDIPAHIQEVENLTVYEPENEISSQVQFEKEQVFGNDESQLNGFIGRLWDVAVDHSGRVYIADSQEMTIKVYDSDGRFLTTLGRRGQGPGELESLTSIQIKGNELYALDRNQQRMVIFSLDSLEHDETVNIADNRDEYDEVAGAYLGSIYAKSDGSFLTYLYKTKMPGNIDDWDKFNGQTIYHFLDSNGDIASQKLFESETSYQVLVPYGPRTIGTPVNFFGKSMTSLSDNDHIIHAWSQDFLVKVYTPEGEYERAFYYPIKTVPLEPELAFNTGNAELIQSAIRSINFPDTWPVLKDLLTDDENRMWISTIIEDQDVYEWWVLEESGSLITRFEWPRDEPIEKVQNGYMYTHDTDDETGSEYIVRYRLEFEER